MANYKKPKYYCYTVSEVARTIEFQGSDDKDTIVEPIRNNQQCQDIFETVEEALDGFLKAEGYTKGVDSDLVFELSTGCDGKNPVAIIGFYKLLTMEGRRPNSVDLKNWKEKKCFMSEHFISFYIVEFTYKTLDLTTIKKSISLNKYLKNDV